jgi:hypothetical protein
MDYRILGTLEVNDGDHVLAVGGEKQRALLAVLCCTPARSSQPIV